MASQTICELIIGKEIYIFSHFCRCSKIYSYFYLSGIRMDRKQLLLSSLLIEKDFQCVILKPKSNMRLTGIVLYVNLNWSLKQSNIWGQSKILPLKTIQNGLIILKQTQVPNGIGIVMLISKRGLDMSQLLNMERTT